MKTVITLICALLLTLRASAQNKVFQAWETYIGLFRKNYDQGQLSILNRAIDYDELLASVRRDVELLGGTPATGTVAP